MAEPIYPRQTTINEVYDPIDTASKVEQLNADKIRNRVDLMKAKNQFDAMKRAGIAQNDPRGMYDILSNQFMPRNPQASGGQPQQPPQTATQGQPMPVTPQNQAPMPPNLNAQPPNGQGRTVTQTSQGMPPQAQGQAMPQQPSMSEEDKLAMNGAKRLQFVHSKINSMASQAKNDPAVGERINKISEMQEKSPEHQALASKMGYDEMSTKYDETDGSIVKILTKNWTAEELQARADKAPNGELLQNAIKNPGKYRISTKNGIISNVEFIGSNKLEKATHEEKVHYAINDPDPEIRRQARAELSEDAKLKKESSASTAGVGGAGLSKDAIEYAAENTLASGIMPNFGYGKQGAAMKAEVANRVAQMAKERGLKVPEVISRQAELKGEKMGMNDLIKRETLIGTFVNRIDSTSNVVLDLAKKINNKDSRMANVPINKLKSMLGSGDLQALDLALTSLSNEIAKVESGSLGIAGVSIDQAKIMARIHDRDLSLNDLKKVIDTGKLLGKTSIDSLKKQRKDLKGEISGQDSKNEPLTIGRFKVEVE
jgi:hypothetical protein